jgi:hypothetical protein
VENFFSAVALLVGALATVALVLVLADYLIDKAQEELEVHEDRTLFCTNTPGEYPIGSLWEGYVITGVVPTLVPQLYRVLGRPSNTQNP